MLSFVDFVICLVTLIVAAAVGATTGNIGALIGICIIGGLIAAAPK